MASWVLIVVFLHGYGPRPTMHTERFVTEEACKAAVAFLMPKLERGNATCLEDRKP